MPASKLSTRFLVISMLRFWHLGFAALQIFHRDMFCTILCCEPFPEVPAYCR